jgi:phosphoglycolate phosphatase-like HAD superfamily hydrolase
MKQERSPDEEIAMRSGLRPPQTEIFLKHVQHIVNRESLLHLDRLQPGVAEALRQLRAAGLRLVLVTLRPTVEATAILADAGLLECFDEICGTHQSAAAYENLVACKQELLSQAILRTELRTGQAPLCLIGDTEADVLAAKALGLISVALTCGIRSSRYLRRLAPDVILPNLLTCARLILANRSEYFSLTAPSLV